MRNYRIPRPSAVGGVNGQYDQYGKVMNDNLPQDLDPGTDDTYRYFFIRNDVWNSTVDFVKKKIDEEGRNWEYKRIISGYEQAVKTDPLLQMIKRLERFQEMKANGLDFDHESDLEDFAQIYPEGQEEIFKELLYVISMLYFTRRDPWVGDLYRGSQMENYDAHLMLANITFENVKALHEEYERNYYGECKQ